MPPAGGGGSIPAWPILGRGSSVQEPGAPWAEPHRVSPHAPPHSQANPPPYWGSEAEGFLGSVDHVEEAIIVLLLLIDVRNGCGHAHHAVLVHQQEEGLRGVQLQAAPGVGRRVSQL